MRKIKWYRFLFSIVFNNQNAWLNSDPWISNSLLKIPPTPYSFRNQWRTEREQGRREKIWWRRGLFVSLFYSTTKLPFFHVRLAHPLGKTQRVALNYIEQRRRDSKSGKKRKENQQEQQQRRRNKEQSCCFCRNSKCPCFLVFLISLYSELLCSECSNHIGGVDVGEILPYNRHRPFSSFFSSWSSSSWSNGLH